MVPLFKVLLLFRSSFAVNQAGVKSLPKSADQNFAEVRNFRLHADEDAKVPIVLHFYESRELVTNVLGNLCIIAGIILVERRT